MTVPHVEFMVTNVGTVRLATTAGKPDLPLSSRSRLIQFEVKRAMDVAASVSAILVLSPLLAAIAALVKLSSEGPVVIRQKRYGKHGNVFHILKFRSMYVDMGDVTGTAQTLKDDPRITPIGRILRHSSLDELPQLFNVLKGEMSLVGPRPHPIGMRAAGRLYEEVVPYYHLRHTVPPGISGLAQVNGCRGDTCDIGRARARVEYDLAYIQNFSLWLDIKIVALTIKSEFLRGSGN